MSRADAARRLARLDLLTSRLKGGDLMTVGGLAEEFGVSPRTMARDIALLRERGVPVEADPGRGGGVRLHRSWGVGRLSLSYREAVELLVSLAIAEQMQAPWLIASLGPIRRKLAASFAPRMRERVSDLNARILIGTGASAGMLEGFSPPHPSSVEALCHGFLERRCLDFRYRDVRGRETVRRAEPQLLLLAYPIWYMVGWDHGRDAVRSFRCDRVIEARLGEADFALRPMAVFEDALRGFDAISP